jgi:hypothetical protein
MPGIGHFLQGIQHIGITVDNLDKSMEFYTDVLGGKVAISGNSFSGEVLQNTMFQKELMEAQILGINPRELGVPDILTGEHDVLDVRFISFGNTVLELLHFRESKLNPSAPNVIKKLPGNVGYANASHISFHVKDDINLNEFALILENECERRNIEICCNRVITMTNEKDRRFCEVRHTANKFWNDPKYFIEGYSDLDFGEFYGWSLFYCKGPNGEQLEFNQVTKTAKGHFERARREYNESNGTEYCWPTHTIDE